MSRRRDAAGDSARLREAAEERLATRAGELPGSAKNTGSAGSGESADRAELLRTVHELQVHQIELELQN
ncbi:MAG TPA: hypothetical protein VFY24_01230, partial [Azospira sp.]|nr:hypothetical protein [Azospira sp.]